MKSEKCYWLKIQGQCASKADVTIFIPDGLTK